MARFEDMLRTLCNNAVSSETKQCVLNRVEILGQKIQSLLDSGSMVMLIHEGHFKKHVLPLLNKTKGDLTEAHSLFWLSVANNEVMLVSKYFEADVTPLGFKVPNVGFLVVKDPNTLLEPQCNTQFPAVIRCNLIRLGCEEFGWVYGLEALRNFNCPENVHPMIFAQMFSFYHQGKMSSSPSQTEPVNLDSNSGSIKVNTSEISSGDVRENPSSSSDAVLGQVWVGSTCEAICIPANCMKVLQGRTIKMTQRLSCMVEARECNNLSLGLVVNRTMVTPNKSKRVPVVIVNTNSYNVWIRQPLLAADMVEAGDCPWDYQPVMFHKGSNIKVSFCPVPPPEIQAEVMAASASNSTKLNDNKPDKTNIEQWEKPKFGPCPKFNNPNFNFERELSWLPYPMNIGDVDMSRTQQQKFLELIYDNQSMFSLCDEDLGLCDHLKHTIPMTTDKPVYLPHRTIPVQLQAEVHKCLDTWLKQGVIRPSRSPYTSQVVIGKRLERSACAWIFALSMP